MITDNDLLKIRELVSQIIEVSGTDVWQAPHRQKQALELIDKLRETKYTWMFLTHPSGDCEEFLVKNGKAWEIETSLGVLEALGIEYDTEEHDFTCSKSLFDPSSDYRKLETEYFEFREKLLNG